MTRFFKKTNASPLMPIAIVAIGVLASCAPAQTSTDTQSSRQLGGTCDASIPQIAKWLGGKWVAQCNKCAVENPTKPDGTQGACPDAAKNLHSWQEVFASEADYIGAVAPNNEICSQDPFALPLPPTKRPVRVRALAGNVPASASEPCLGEPIAFFDPSKTGTTPAAPATATAPAATVSPATVSPTTGTIVGTAGATVASTPTPVPAVVTPASPVSAPAPAAPPAALPKFVFVVKASLNTYLKTDYKFQAAQLSSAQKCLLVSNEKVPVRSYSRSSAGRHIAIVLAEPKCGFGAGSGLFIFEEHFQTLPADLPK